MEKTASVHQKTAQNKTTIRQRTAAGPDGISIATNKTGLPDSLKTGIESLSGMSLDDVRGHTNSSRQAQLNALAYAQGSDIHVGRGQKRHLPHEAWHVVQKKQDPISHLPTVLQLKKIDVSGGTFEDQTYEANNGGGKRVTFGATMNLKFMPKNSLDANEVSLVQTTNSTLRNLDNPHVPDQPESLLNERRTPFGSAIDQQIYNLGENKAPDRIDNLDPRYTETRTSVDQPLRKGNRMGGGNAATKYTQEEKEQGGSEDVWRAARLKDQPGHTIDRGQRLVGSEQFEVAAMADGEEYLGSIRWGFTIKDGRSVLDPAEIKLVNYGSASSEFFAAGEAWNSMRVLDPSNQTLRSPIQLPTRASIKNRKALKRVTMWVNAMTKRYSAAQQHHFDTLTHADFGEYLLTGKIASWERSDDDAPVTNENEPILQRTLSDLLETYPQGEQYLSGLTHEQFGEFLVTGEIAAWEIMRT